jgi:hypothetical protein
MRAQALEPLDRRRAEGERVAFELFQHARAPAVELNGVSIQSMRLSRNVRQHAL